MKKVAWDYVVPVKLPADLKGVEPGKLPANLLKPAAGGGKLHHLACNAWNAMVEAAAAEGVVLKPTSSGDTYREYELQKKGFLQRYSLQDTGTGKTKTFEGKTWYLKKGMATLATPGKSQHNLGLAVDVHSAAEPKRLNWLIANVKKFGFSWEVVPEEPWHLRYVCGDAVPEVVKDYVARNPREASPFGTVAEQRAAAEVKTAAPATNATAAATKRVIKLGSKGPLVKEAQTLLVKHNFNCKIDGDFGPKTAQLVKDFQNKKGIPATGEVDQATWSILLG
jgi:hypothetical protein